MLTEQHFFVFAKCQKKRKDEVEEDFTAAVDWSSSDFDCDLVHAKFKFDDDQAQNIACDDNQFFSHSGQKSGR